MDYIMNDYTNNYFSQYESLAKIGKAKFDRRVTNNNMARSETDTTRVSQNEIFHIKNEEIIDDEGLVDIITS